MIRTHLRTPHRCAASTVLAVRELPKPLSAALSVLNDRRKLEGRDELPFEYTATLSAIARDVAGDVSKEREDEIRVTLGLAPLHERACPTCGDAHSLGVDGRPIDCSGRNGTVAVSISRPSSQRRRRRRYYRPCLSPEYADWSAAQIEALIKRSCHG